MKGLDINIEYERVFGASHYPNIIEEDVEYRKLRKEIIETPPIYHPLKNLPFEGVEDYSTKRIFENHEAKKKIHNTKIFDILIAIRNHATDAILGILTSLGNEEVIKKDSLPISYPEETNHIFWLIMPKRCRAYGYLDKKTKNFYIGTGSLISLIVDGNYIPSSSYRNRQKLIDKYGTKTGIYIKLKKDVKCRSAIAAARYVTGSMVNLDLWQDNEGKTLFEIYPEVLSR